MTRPPDAGPEWWQAGRAHLAAVDPVMAVLADRYADSVLVPRGAPCETLLRAVVGQQISVKAADAVWRRFSALAGDGVCPETVAGLPDDALRGAGLSFRKIGYIRGIAQGFATGAVNPARWAAEPDETILRELVGLPGIGRWTAEMFLIFHLLRPNVLPVDDLGLLKAFEICYGPVAAAAGFDGAKRWRRTGEALALKGRAWAPYRSLATWYLWRSLDPVEVIY